MPTEVEEVKKIADEMGTLIKDLRSTHATALEAEIKKLGVGEMKQTLDKMHARFDVLEDGKKKLEESLTELRRNRLTNEQVTGADGEKTQKPADYDEIKAQFSNFLRVGDNEGRGNLKSQKGVEFHVPKDKDGKKSMSVISDPDGGFTVQADTNGRIRKKIFETSPILPLIDIQTIGTDALEGVIDDTESSAGWVGEVESRTETNTNTIGLWRIPVQELYALPKATQKLLDDSNWDIERYIIDKASEKMARMINLACVSGIDPKQPRGFLTYPAGTNFRTQVEQIPMLGASAITANGLVYVQDSLKDDYRPNAKWAFNRQTRRDIRVLVDSYGRYLLEPGLAMGTPGTVLGDEYVIFQDMPVVAADALAVAYADWKQFYQGVERQGIRILRDPYTAKGYVLFYITRRFGADVANHEAGKIGKVSVS